MSTPQDRPTEQDVERVLAEVLERHAEDTHYGDLEGCACRKWAGRSQEDYAAHVAAEQAAALRALPTGDEALAKAWDEGFRKACSDHRGYSSCATGDHGQRRVNPYLTTPPAQDPSKETDR